jgi:glycolate oxidase FAD binding subunit
MSDEMRPPAGDSGTLEVPDAIVPRFDEPTTTKEVEAVVRDAASAETGLLIAGGRTRIHVANPARRVTMGLSMQGLVGVDEFEPEEGVLHARAGTPIRDIDVVAKAEGWELPLDTPGLTSTLGGTIATAATGPRAQAFGRVPDAVLGLDVVGADGTASKCGGRVVKNVTGYDLAKLYCGSFGSLAVITGAWIRLRPVPASRVAFSARALASTEGLETCRSLAALTSVRAIVWQATPAASDAEVAIELGGSEEGVVHDRERIARVLDLSECASDRIDVMRDSRAEVGTDQVVVRARSLGTECAALARRILDSGLSVSVDPGRGVIHARGRLEKPEQLISIRESARAAGGFATFEVLPEAWRSGLDVFGEADEAHALMASLKHRFDPMGTLNPGRFMAGI